MAGNSKQSFYIDPRTIRPNNSGISQPSEKHFSLEYANSNEVQKKLFVFNYLQLIIPTAYEVYLSYLFFTDDYYISPYFYRDNWNPWISKNEMINILRATITSFPGEIKQVCKDWLDFFIEFSEITAAMARFLARNLGLEDPQNVEDFLCLTKSLESVRVLHGASWSKNIEFQELSNRLVELLKYYRKKMPDLRDFITRLQEDKTYQVTMDDFRLMERDEPIRRKVDRLQDHPDHQKVIIKLSRLLDDAKTKKCSPDLISYIYSELGFRYSLLDEKQLAVECYSNCLANPGLHNPLDYFFRAELNYALQDWEKALADYEKAIEWEIYSPELEQSQARVDELRKLLAR